MDDIISSIEAHQIRTEAAGPLSDSEEQIRQQLSARERFYSALDDAAVPDVELVTLAAETGGGIFAPPDLDHIAKLRNRLARFPIQFTRAEPPTVASLLAQSFGRVSRFARRELATARFVLATDCIYRPHASVQEWAQDRYLVMMSRYLLADLPQVANVIAQFICEVSKPDDASPWLDHNFPATLLEGIERSSMRWHLAYALCAAAEGERYRVVMSVDRNSRHDQIVNEIWAGAVDFLMAHEIAHVALGHLRGVPSETHNMPPFFRDLMEEIREVGGAEGQRLVDFFIRVYWPSYERELAADAMGLLWTGGDGPTGAWDLRLIGAQLAISTISFLDRAKYLIAHGKDPCMLIGFDKYSLPGLVDVILPRPGHPWGKTRSYCVANALFGLYQSLIPKRELQRKARLMRVVADIVTSFTASALEVVRHVNSTPGEFVAILAPDNRPVTLHFPLEPDALTEHKTIESDASQFYFDLTSRVLHHQTIYIRAAALYRQEAENDEQIVLEDEKESMAQ